MVNILSYNCTSPAVLCKTKNGKLPEFWASATSLYCNRLCADSVDAYNVPYIR